jgi:hypothetical protein
MAKFRGSTVWLFLRLLLLAFFWILLAWTFWAYSQQMNAWVQDSPNDKSKAFDFRVFHQGLQEFVKHGSLYKGSDGTSFALGNYNGNSPAASFIQFPLVFFPLNTALAIWNILGYSLFVGGLFLLWHTFKNDLPKRVYWLVALFVYIYITYPVIETLQLGAWGLLVTFLDLACWYCARHSYNKLAGIFLGLALCVRWQPFVLFFLFLAIKRWSVVISSIVTVIALYLCAILTFGTRAIFEFLEVVSTLVTNRDGSLVRGPDGSLRAFIGRIFELIPNSSSLGTLITLLWLICSLVLFFGTLWRCTKVSFDNAFGLCIICGLLLAPTSWMHYHTALILPIVLVVFVQKRVWVGIFFGLFWIYPHFLVNLLYIITGYDLKQVPNIFNNILTLSLFLLYFYLFRTKEDKKEGKFKPETKQTNKTATFALNES